MRETRPPHGTCHHRMYGLTCEQFDALRARAGDHCEQCGVRAEDVQKPPLCIDHDGRIGTGWDHVRGLLCCKCNSAMRYVDNGFRKPTPVQQAYLDNSWFWTNLPAERLGQPWLPESCKDASCAALSRTWKSLETARLRAEQEEQRRVRREKRERRSAAA